MHIALITTSISLGGISSYLINFANYLCQSGHKVTVFYTSAVDEIKERLDDRIKLVVFHQPDQKKIKIVLHYVFNGKLLSMIRLKLRRKNQKPYIKDIQNIQYINAKLTKRIEGNYDVAISSAEFYCNYLVDLKVNSKRKIAWVHPDLSTLKIDMTISEKVMSHFDRICVVSKACHNSLENIFPKFKNKIITIENLIDQESIVKMSKEKIDESVFIKGGLNIVTVCRLDNSSKRLDRLIKICKYLKLKGVGFVWNIIGDGKDFQFLHRLAEQENVLDVVNFLGSKTNPYPYIVNSDVFVLTSQYEGKPIVVDEALALHVPCIVTDYLSAKKQIGLDYGSVIENNDNTVCEEFYSVLTEKNIAVWNNNLKNYYVDNEKIKTKINVLLG